MGQKYNLLSLKEGKMCAAKMKRILEQPSLAACFVF